PHAVVAMLRANVTLDLPCEAGVRRFAMRPVFAFVVIAAIAQQPEPAVSKDSLSVHRVERGDMPLREIADGSISSIAPPRAAVIVSAEKQATSASRSDMLRSDRPAFSSDGESSTHQSECLERHHHC